MADSLTERGDTRPCDGCGLLAGADACRSLFQWNLPTRSGDVRYGRRHRMAVDTYCLQHSDSYCASAKSLAAHLTGLCAAFESSDVERALAAVQRWLSSNPPIKKPPLPEQRGALTIETVLVADSPDAYVKAAEAWARSTWAAHAALHDVAREWIRAAAITRP